MSRDTFSLLSEREQAARLTAKRTLGEHMSGILLGICLVLTAVLPLVVLRLVNPFSEGFLIRTAYTALTSTLTYLLFIPEGKRAEWRHNSALTEAQDRLRALSSMVRAGHLSDFSLFCQGESERALEKERSALLSLSEADTGRARRLRKRAERLRLCRISPALVLFGEEAGAHAELTDRQRGRNILSALCRPIPVLFSSLLFSSVVILPGAAPDAATAVRILTGLFGVATAAFAGFAAGGESARGELRRLRARILFLSSFCEEKGIAVA